MSDVEEYARALKDSMTLFDEAGKKLSDLSGFKIDQLVESYLFMFDRFCPFKVGERVVLTTTPDFNRAWGWQGAEHWLKAGASGIVRTRGYSDSHFTFHVEFDGESWKDSEGLIHPVQSKHLYHFRERDLAGLKEPESHTDNGN